MLSRGKRTESQMQCARTERGHISRVLSEKPEAAAQSNDGGTGRPKSGATAVWTF